MPRTAEDCRGLDPPAPALPPSLNILPPVRHYEAARVTLEDDLKKGRGTAHGRTRIEAEEGGGNNGWRRRTEEVENEEEEEACGGGLRRRDGGRSAEGD